MNYTKYNKTSLHKMNTDLNIIYRYAGKDSILNTVCDDKKIDISDIDSKLVTAEDRKLLITALQYYDKKVWEMKTTDEQHERLKYLDRYLDIPALALFYSKPDYKLLSRFISNEYDQIPVDLFKSEVVLTDFYKYGSEKELDWMLKNKLTEINADLPANLAEFGNLKLLRYAREKGCPWDDRTPALAAFKGHLNCLRYAHENECPWDNYTPSAAAENGHLECLRYAHEKGCPWDEDTPYFAARNGHLDCLKYVHKNGCPWDKYTPAFAAFNGHLDCLRYAHENGCPWDEITPHGAAENGNLVCLRYAHENKCQWDTRTPKGAALKGHLNCLRYAHENECPWDEWTTYTAAVYGRLNCLRYAYEYDCPINIEECLSDSHINCKGLLLKIKNQNQTLE